MAKLREATSAERALAWVPRPWRGEDAPRRRCAESATHRDGGAYLAAADYAGDPPSDPQPGEYAALARLPGARALCDREALADLAKRHGALAAAPVRAASGEILAVLLVGGGPSSPPRVLAALDAATRRLAAPLRAAVRLERLDAEARRLHRLAGLGALTAEVAHEIRNPLTSLSTFVQLLPERRDDPAFVDRFLGVVQDELGRLERLLENVLAQGAPRDAAGTPGRVGEAVQAVLELLRYRAASLGVRLESEVAPGLPATALDTDGLRQVILNLALNGLGATPRGGSVRIGAVADDGVVRLSVCDDGPGLPAERRAWLSRPAGAEAEPGTGLGLAITRRLVEEAGGRLECGDGPGGELRITLPGLARPRAR